MHLLWTLSWEQLRQWSRYHREFILMVDASTGSRMGPGQCGGTTMTASVLGLVVVVEAVSVVWGGAWMPSAEWFCDATLAAVLEIPCFSPSSFMAILWAAQDLFKKFLTNALAGVAQWSECWPADRKVSGSIPSQDTHRGCVPGPQLGLCER